MKSKKFFILALAAAVLFAFAACQPGSVSYTDLNRIEIEQTGTILVGQDPKDTDFTVTGYFNNEGTPVKATITYLDEAGKDAATKAVAVQAKATITASSFGKPVTLTDIVTITKTDITSLEFSGAETAFTFEQTEESAAKIKAAAESLASGKYTVTANGSVAIDASVYTAVKAGITTEDGNIFDTEEDGDAVITALLDEANLGKTLPVVLQITVGDNDMTATTNVTITMTEESADPTVTGFEFIVSESAYYGAGTGAQIKLSYSDGTTATSPVENYNDFVIVETTNGNAVVSSFAQTFDWTAHTYRVTYRPDTAIAKEVTIPAGQNYATNVTVGPKALADGATYKYGQSISSNDIDVKLVAAQTVGTAGEDDYHPVADSIISVSLIGVSNIPTKEALEDATEFAAPVRVVYTSMGKEQTLNTTVTFGSLSSATT